MVKQDAARRQCVPLDGAPGGRSVSSQETRAPSQGVRRPDRKGLAKGASQAPGALPALHSPILGNGKRDDGFPGAVKEYGR